MAASRDSDGRALQRILSTPHLAQAVPRLPAELLHRLIQHHGLEDTESARYVTEDAEHDGDGEEPHEGGKANAACRQQKPQDRRRGSDMSC